MLLHDSHKALFRQPAGPAPAGSAVTIRFLCDEAACVILRTWAGQELAYPMQFDGERTWSYTLAMPKEPGLFWYDFIIYHRDGRILRYGNREDMLGGEGRLWPEGIQSFQITVYDPAFETPRFIHGANIYQIFPDRFHRAATAAVDNRTDRHIHQSWDEDLLADSDPRSGDHMALDMDVILDGVFSHTGEDSLYFNHFGHYDSVGAYQGPESPYYDWYTFKGSRDEYTCWWGIPSLPACRKDNPSYQHFMFREKEGIVPRWIHAGSSGWRLDVADELSMDFLRKLRRSAKQADPQALVLGEVWEDASAKVSYGELRCYCTGDTLDSVMNYPLRDAILAFVTGQGTAHDLARLINHQAEVYPAQFRYSLMNLIGSHDRPRALNTLCGREGNDLCKADQQTLRLTPAEYDLAVRRYKLCVDILCAVPGCPTIYYGDEAGLTGCRDPFCRRPFPWAHQDQVLHDFVAAKLTHHQESDVLKYGHCQVDVIDSDTLTITRYLDGTDAFGRPASQQGKEVFTIRR